MARDREGRLDSRINVAGSVGNAEKDAMTAQAQEPGFQVTSNTIQ